MKELQRGQAMLVHVAGVFNHQPRAGQAGQVFWRQRCAQIAGIAVQKVDPWVLDGGDLVDIHRDHLALDAIHLQHVGKPQGAAPEL